MKYQREYFWQDSEEHIQWTLYYPIRPQERRNNATDTDRSHDNDNMTNVLHPDYIHTTHIHTIP